MRFYRILALLFVAVLLAEEAGAQTNTPTATDTPTPTNTATAVIAATSTPAATNTPNTLPGGQQIYNPLVVGSIDLPSGSVRVWAPQDGGDYGFQNRIYGVLAQEIVAFGTMVNGTAEVVSFIDASPAGEWTAHDSTVTVSTATDHFMQGKTTSLKLAFGSGAVDQSGAVSDITNDDWEANEGFQYCILASETVAAGDLALWVEDTGVNTRFLFPAVPQANAWTCAELPVSSLGGGSGDVVNKIHVILTTQGAAAHDAFSINLSTMYKWDADDEEALGFDVFCAKGAVKAWVLPTTPSTSNIPVKLTEGTDFFEVCRQGNDAVVIITDQSANAGLANVAVQP